MAASSASSPSPRGRRLLVGAALLAAVLVAIVVAALTLREDEVAATTTVPVSAFPSPGDGHASARAQISFRGARREEIGTIRVRGSDSGRHDGRWRAHGDGTGASFIPDEPFEPGERVEVETTLNVRQTNAGDFSFTVAGTPVADGFRAAAADQLTRGKGEVQNFRSRPDLRPPALEVTTSRPGLARGRLLLGPKNGRGQDGPMIVDNRGKVLWFQPMTGTDQAADVRVQRYRGRPVLTWWQGRLGFGQGRGEGVILDRNYEEVARVRTGNGYRMDLHDFVLTDRGTALVNVYQPVPTDLSSVGGAKEGIAIEGVVQEIDIETGLVLFEWHSLDHVGLDESYYTTPKGKNEPWDYFHINSVEEDTDGDLLVSARHTFAIYKIDRETGDVIWRLNGKRSDFEMGEGAPFAWQHDARRLRGGRISLFDNAHSVSAPKPAQAATDGPGREESRALVLRVDEARRRATVERSVEHPDRLLADNQAGTDVQPNGNLVVGWGSAAHVSEFDRDGDMLLDIALAEGNDTYRAYRSVWRGQPRTDPTLVAAPGEDGRVVVSASWNGATEVARWTFLAGSAPGDLRPVARARRQGFETTLPLRTDGRLLAVRALDARGRVLGTSRPVEAPAG